MYKKIEGFFFVAPSPKGGEKETQNPIENQQILLIKINLT